MENIIFFKVKSYDPRVKTFNASGTLWDIDVDLLKFYRFHHYPNMTDVQVAFKLWNDGNNENKFLPSQWWAVFWSVMFSSIVLASLFGNLVAVWTVLSDKKMRSVTNYFLVNLSISDITQSILVTIFSFVFLLTQEWHTGSLTCIMTQYLAVVCVSCNSFTLMAISLERFFAIVYPLRRRPATKLITLISIALLWTASFIIAMPQAMYAKYRRLDQAERYVCVLEWPDEPKFFGSSMEFAYNMALTVVVYCIPLCTMAIAYSKAGLKLWGNSIGEITEQQLRNVKSKRKVVKMLIASVIVFCICWLPYHAYFLASWLYPPINYWEHMQQVYLGIFWLAMSSSAHSPFVYCFMNSTFRTGFKRVYRFWCFCLKRRNAASNASSDGVTRQYRHAATTRVVLCVGELNKRSCLSQTELPARVPLMIPQLRETLSRRSFTMQNHLLCNAPKNFTPTTSKKIRYSVSLAQLDTNTFSTNSGDNEKVSKRNFARETSVRRCKSEDCMIKHPAHLFLMLDAVHPAHLPAV